MKAEHWSDAVRAGLKKVSDWLLSSGKIFDDNYQDAALERRLC